jgi:hypothetical protein
VPSDHGRDLCLAALTPRSGSPRRRRLSWPATPHGYIGKAIARGVLQASNRRRDWLPGEADVLVYAKKMPQLGPQKHGPRRAGVREEGEIEGCAI